MRVYVLAFVALIGCKKKLEPGHGDAIAKMAEFKDQMCVCRDKACADKVQGDMTKWSTDMAAKYSDRRDEKADEATMKMMTEVGQAYGECMTRAMSPVPQPPPEPPAPEPAPPVVAPAPSPPTPIGSQADALFRQAREWVAKEGPGRLVSRVKFSYVDAKGILDPTYGEIDIVFGRLDETQAKRRLGTPVQPRVGHDDCFSMGTSGGRWVLLNIPCTDTIEYAPRCSVPTIWKRATAKRTYEDAVAVITLDVPTKTWELVIDDEPTNLHVKESFLDDCELRVER